MAKSNHKKAPSKKSPLGHDLPENLKWKIVGDNPRRKGSGPFKQYELMRRYRSLSSFLNAGGRRMWIPGAVRRKFIAKVGR